MKIKLPSGQIISQMPNIPKARFRAQSPRVLRGIHSLGEQQIYLSQKEFSKLVEQEAMKNSNFLAIDNLYRVVEKRVKFLQEILPTLPAEYQPLIQERINVHADTAGKMWGLRGQILGEIETKVKEDLKGQGYSLVFIAGAVAATGGPQAGLLALIIVSVTRVTIAIFAYLTVQEVTSAIKKYFETDTEQAATTLKLLEKLPPEVALKWKQQEQEAEKGKKHWYEYLFYAVLAGGGLYLAAKILPGLINKRQETSV